MIYLVIALFAIALSTIAVGISSIFSRSRALLALFVALLLANTIVAALLIQMHVSTQLSIFSVNGFSLLLIILLSIFFILSLIASYHFERLNLLLLLSSLSYLAVFMVVFSRYLLTMVIGLEALSLSSVLMLLLKGRHSTEAAAKLFILGALAVSLLLMALPIVFYYTNASLHAPISNAPMPFVLVAIVLVAAGLSIDAAQFPFNFWVPDVYEAAPANITALISSVNKAVAFIAIMLVFFIVFPSYKAEFSQLFFVLAILTMFFGNLVALVQKSVKRMLAYSSISQAGYIMIGIAVASTAGIQASIFQIFAYGIAAIGSFSVIQALEARGINTIDEYAGLAKANKPAAYSLSIFMLSMAGFPLLIGFAGKFLLFASAVQSNLLLLAAFGILNSFISIYYYGRVLSSMYMDKPHKRFFLDKPTLAVLFACVAIIIAFGIYPAMLSGLAATAASSI